MKNIFRLENMKDLLNKQFKNKTVQLILFNGINQYIDINNFATSLNGNNKSLSLQFGDISKNSIILYIIDKDLMYMQYEPFNNSFNIYLVNKQIIQICLL